MHLVNVAERKMWVGPDEIFRYFGLSQPESPKVELWSVRQILEDYNAHPDKWQATLPAANGLPKRNIAFSPSDDIDWHWDPRELRATNGKHGAITMAAEVIVNPDGQRIFLYSKMHRTNGKPSGKFQNGIEEGTVGAHTAPVIFDKKTGMWMLGFLMQYRPDMRFNGVQGAWSAGVPGGYGLGNPTQLALEELHSEYGLEMVQSYVPLGWTNADRAQWGDADQLGIAIFRIEDVHEILEQQDHEIILKAQYLVDIRMYPNQLDQYDSQTVAWAREYLQLHPELALD